MINYDIVGTAADKPTLVFVHGLTCAADDWERQVRSFANTHRCISVDLRGHGRSHDMMPLYDMETLAADVVAVLRKHDARNSILIGHSMGTRVITAAAIQAPEYVSGLVYVDGSIQAQGDPQAAADAIAASLGEDSAVAEFITKMFGAMFTDRSDATVRKSIIQRAVDMQPAVFRQLLGNLLAWDAGRLVSAVKQVHIPLIVLQSTNVDENRTRRCLVAGERTPYLQLLQQHVPQADIRVVPDCGHFTQLDAPNRVNDAIQDMSAALTNH